MLKENYKHLFDQVSPTNDLLNQTLQTARQHEKEKKSVRFTWRRPAMVFVCACLCIALAMPALAATVEPVYRLMYMVSPSVAQFFMPVQKSDEDNGIKMEVLSAYIHDNAAEIYITMQDLTGERIDGTTDLYDSYSINRPFSSCATCKLVDYNEETKTATFFILIEEWGNKDITGDKITFTVKEFLSHKNAYEDIAVPVDLSAVTTALKTQAVSTIGGGGIMSDNSMFDNDVKALVPVEPMEELKVDGIDLTGVGYIDGKLHVQMAVTNRLANDNHGFFYLKDSDGTIVESDYSFYFIDENDQQERVDYCEYVFDVSKEDLSKYTLFGDFVTTSMRTQGNWKVTFPLENAS